MQRLGTVLLILASLLYPLAVYIGQDRIRPPTLAALLAASWLLRLLAWPGHAPRPWLTSLAALAYCALLAWHPLPGIERWYPCVVNLGLAIVFAASLRQGPSAIERLARLQEPELPPAGVAYTRRVTQVWLGFFILNGAMAALLSRWGSLHWWTLYNGGLAYVLIGLLFGAEYCLRRRVRLQHRTG